MSESLSVASKDEIVVYQPDNTLRLEVRVIDESVWLNQMQLCELFGVVKSTISYHLKNIFETGELERDRTVRKIRTVQYEGGRSVSRSTDFFNLEVVISIGFRINNSIPSADLTVGGIGVIYAAMQSHDVDCEKLVNLSHRSD